MSLKFQKKNEEELLSTPGKIEIDSNNNQETQKIEAKYLQLLTEKSEVSFDSNYQKLQETKCLRKWDFTAHGTRAIPCLA